MAQNSTDQVANQIAERVRAAVKDARIPTLTLAERSGIPESTLRRRLSGGDTLLTVAEVAAIAAVIDVPAAVLLRVEDVAA